MTMTMNEIINKGNEIQLENLPWTTSYTPLTILLCTILILSFIGICYSLWRSKGNISIVLLTTSILMFITITGVTLKEMNTVKNEVLNEIAMEWREEVAKEYIESLPITKKELESVQVDLESEALNKYTRNWWQIKYTDYGNEFITLATYSFKENDDTVKEEGMFEIISDLETNEKPYIQYQHLTEDLGHGVHDGFYNAVIHIPNDLE